MCEFCSSILDKRKNVYWGVRSVIADNNVEEFIEKSSEHKIKNSNCYFPIEAYEDNGNVSVIVSYRHEIILSNDEKITISPFSEGMKFNFCPFCGEQISKDVEEFKMDNTYGIVSEWKSREYEMEEYLKRLIEDDK